MAVLAVGVGAQHGLLDSADFADLAAQLAIFLGKAVDEFVASFQEFAGSRDRRTADPPASAAPQT